MTAVRIDTRKVRLRPAQLDGVGRVLGERTFPTHPDGLAALGRLYLWGGPWRGAGRPRHTNGSS